MKNMLYFILILMLYTSSCIKSSKKEETNYLSNNEENIEINTDEDKLSNLEEKMEELEKDNKQSKVIKQIIQQDAEGAKLVQVDINIGACRLNLSGGSKHLFTGGFAYTQKEWKPEYSYSVHNNTGNLNISQAKTDNVNYKNDDKYVWNLKFGNQIPLAFDINLGAGLSEIKLGSLPVTNFNMAMGVGKTILDLRGKWKTDTEIHLEGGIGLLQIKLPEKTGIKINITKGLANISTHRLKKIDKNTYLNKFYNKSKTRIDIYLNAGIGQIEIE